MRTKFSLLDYFRMFKARGIKFCFSYFFQNHLFDLVYGVNTHLRNDPKDYLDKPNSFENGIWYVCAKTNRLKSAINEVSQILGDKYNSFQFMDLGSGKGKSILVYLMQIKLKNLFPAIGIEYYQPLVNVAQRNLQILKYEDFASVTCDDAANFHQYCNTKNLIVYLYNPFSIDILGPIILKFKDFQVIVIYIDPAEIKHFELNGFKTIYENKGTWPADNFVIMQNF